MGKSQRLAVARSTVVAIGILLTLTGCSSFVDTRTTVYESAEPGPVDTTSADRCEILVALPGGLAPEVAARKDCVEVNGKWVPAESVQPSAPSSTARDWAAGGSQWPAGGISWSEATSHVGETQTVCGPLAGSGYSEDDAFLNLGLDYPDRGRFQIVVWDVGRLEPIPLRSTLCATGRITLYEGVGQIELTDPGAVLIYD